MQITFNEEQTSALRDLLAQMEARCDAGDPLGPVTFTKQGLDGAITVGAPSDGSTYEISAGGTIDVLA